MALAAPVKPGGRTRLSPEVRLCLVHPACLSKMRMIHLMPGLTQAIPPDPRERRRAVPALPREDGGGAAGLESEA